jgi:hypothetical protein
MELNGVANIKMMVEMGIETKEIDPVLAIQIKQQLVLLERYLLAYQDHQHSIKAGAYGALIVEIDEPRWHEVKANPQEYPTNAERSNRG